MQLGSVLQTHHFCVGPEKYFKRKSWKFCFGQSRHVTIEVVRNEIQKLISKRDVILIVHGGKDDLAFVKAADIHLRPLYIMDTQKAAQHPLQLDYRCTIEGMLTLVNCSFDQGMLHNAGTDAHFTLRALLLIATMDATTDPTLEPACKALLSTFEKIARQPIPLERFLEAVEADLKREYNRAQNRRHRRNVLRKEENRVKRGKNVDSKASSSVVKQDV
jgi:hypothetical protein